MWTYLKCELISLLPQRERDRTANSSTKPPLARVTPNGQNDPKRPDATDRLRDSPIKSQLARRRKQINEISSSCVAMCSG